MSNFLHWLAHKWDDTLCRCRANAFMEGIRFRRDIELKELELPSSPDAMRDEMWMRRAS
jgi:tRNA pseudouridine-54 N-methylase